MKRIILVLLLALFIRAVPACLFFGSYDSFILEKIYHSAKAADSYELYGLHAFEHSPGFFWWLGIVGLFVRLTALPFHIAFKLPAICADLAITALIYRAFMNSGTPPKEAANRAALYALNPIAVLITSVSGQADSILAFFCFLAWYFWKFGKKFRIPSAVFLGIGAIVKEVPVILIPAFFGKLRRFKERRDYLIFFLLPVLIALIAAYFTTGLGFISNLLKYQSSSGFWGVSLLSRYLAHSINNGLFAGLPVFVRQYMRWVSLAALGFAWAACFKKKDALTSILLIFTAFYFTAPGFAAQYLVWIVPFAVMARDPMLKFYTIFVSILLALWYIPVLVTGDPAASYHSIRWLNFTRNLFSVLGWATAGIWSRRLLKAHFTL